MYVMWWVTVYSELYSLQQIVVSYKFALYSKLSSLTSTSLCYVNVVYSKLQLTNRELLHLALLCIFCPIRIFPTRAITKIIAQFCMGVNV